MLPFVKIGKLKDVRGKGLLNAIEFHDSDTANKAVNKMMDNGLLTKVTKNGTVRMCPPLIISKEEMNDSLEIIKGVIKKM